MNEIERINTLGYRRWHERRLIFAHGHLVLCIIALVMLAAMLEVMTREDGQVNFLGNAALLFCSGALALWGWLKYVRHMVVANGVSGFVSCERCNAIGAISADRNDSSMLTLRCKRCEHTWRVETDLFKR